MIDTVLVSLISGCSALAGAGITALVALRLKKIDYDNILKKEDLKARNEYQEKHLIEPAINFIRLQLRYMANLYDLYMKRIEIGDQKELLEHVWSTTITLTRQRQLHLPTVDA